MVRVSRSTWAAILVSGLVFAGFLVLRLGRAPADIGARYEWEVKPGQPVERIRATRAEDEFFEVAFATAPGFEQPIGAWFRTSSDSGRGIWLEPDVSGTFLMGSLEEADALEYSLVRGWSDFAGDTLESQRAYTVLDVTSPAGLLSGGDRGATTSGPHPPSRSFVVVLDPAGAPVAGARVEASDGTIIDTSMRGVARLPAATDVGSIVMVEPPVVRTDLLPLALPEVGEVGTNIRLVRLQARPPRRVSVSLTRPPTDEHKNAQLVFESVRGLPRRAIQDAVLGSAISIAEFPAGETRVFARAGEWVSDKYVITSHNQESVEVTGWKRVRILVKGVPEGEGFAPSDFYLVDRSWQSMSRRDRRLVTERQARQVSHVRRRLPVGVASFAAERMGDGASIGFRAIPTGTYQLVVLRDGIEHGAEVRVPHVGASTGQVQLDVPMPSRATGRLDVTIDGQPPKGHYFSIVLRAPGLETDPVRIGADRTVRFHDLAQGVYSLRLAIENEPGSMREWRSPWRNTVVKRGQEQSLRLVPAR